MSARPWRVEYSETRWSDFWEWSGSYSENQTALTTAASEQRPGRKYRLLNRDTGEVIHLDETGHPAAEVMRRQAPADLDTIRARASVLAGRTHEQDMADRASAQYEAQLDRQGGEDR